MHYKMKRYLLLGVIITLLGALLGCNGGGGINLGTLSGIKPDNLQVGEVKLKSNTKVFYSNEDLNLLEVSSDGTIYTYSPSSKIANGLKNGDIIIGVKGKGYLRKVKSVDKTTPGKIIVTTEHANLEDSVDKLYFKLSHEFKPEQIRQASYTDSRHIRPRSISEATGYIKTELGHELEDLVIYDEDKNLETTDDQITMSGSIDIIPGFYMEADIGLFGIKKIEFYSKNELSTDLTVTYDRGFNVLKKEIKVMTYDFTPITFMAGPLPVIITPTLEIWVGIDANLKAAVKTSISWDYQTKAGLSYTDGGWSQIKSINSDFSYQPPHCSLSANAKGYIAPQLEIFLYNVAGPYAEGEAYVEANIQPLSSPQWELWAGFQINAGIEFEVGIFKTGHEYPKIIDFRKLIASGNIEPPLSFGVERDPSDPSKVLATISAIIDSGLPRTDLTYNNFSLEEDYVWREDYTVQLASLSGTWASADIAILIDCTGSMGEEINGVRNSVIAFADFLEAKHTCIRIAGIPFWDYVGKPFHLTEDIASFKTWISSIYASGGGDTPENDLDAIMTAINSLSWRKNTQHIIIIITDATYHYAGDGSGFTSYSTADVISALQSRSIILHSISPLTGWNGYPVIADVAPLTGGMAIKIPANGNVDLTILPTDDAISASYIMRWPDTDSDHESIHNVIIKVYKTAADRNARKPWRSFSQKYFY